jgi:hypothetical protein
MDKQQPGNKIYITLIGSAPMASIDALLISLDRFKQILDSDSARDQFETAVRSIQPDLKSVHTFIDAVYAKKDPRSAVTMKGRTLVVEINQTSKDFYDCIQDHDIEDILSHVTAVGSLPAVKPANIPTRDYTVYPVRYMKGNFIKIANAL